MYDFSLIYKTSIFNPLLKIIIAFIYLLVAYAFFIAGKKYRGQMGENRQYHCPGAPVMNAPQDCAQRDIIHDVINGLICFIRRWAIVHRQEHPAGSHDNKEQGAQAAQRNGPAQV